jgi:hypothetical protein
MLPHTPTSPVRMLLSPQKLAPQRILALASTVFETARAAPGRIALACFSR